MNEQSLTLMMEGLSIEIPETGQYGKYFQALDSGEIDTYLEQNAADTPIKKREPETLSTGNYSETLYVVGFRKTWYVIPERIPSVVGGFTIGGLIAGLFCRQVQILNKRGFCYKYSLLME